MLVNFLLAYYGNNFDQCGWKPRELYMVLMVFSQRLASRSNWPNRVLCYDAQQQSGRDGRVNLVTRDHQNLDAFPHASRFSLMRHRVRDMLVGAKFLLMSFEWLAHQTTSSRPKSSEGGGPVYSLCNHGGPSDRCLHIP